MNNFKIRHRILSGVLFFVYIIALVYFMFFSEMLGRSIVSVSYNYNLIPFKEISRFIRYSHVLGMGAVVANLLGNVIAFVPFGLFLPCLINHKFGYAGMTILSLDLSLSIEILQLVCKVGSFDVDDLLLNTLGGFLGYFIFRMILRYGKRNVNVDEQSKIQ